MEESASMEIQLATASINNVDQNTQKEADIPGENENKNDELVIDIREMFKRPKIRSSTQCHIYKVLHYLRKWNEEAYTPQVISIGPFHHKNERLKAMEEHKEIYFRNFVERSEIKLDLKGLTSDDPMAGEPRADAVMLYLLLLENQFPFFVIEKLYFNMQFIEASPNVKIEHFTDLLRTFQIPPPCKRPYRGYRMIDLLFTATQHHDAGVGRKCKFFQWRDDEICDRGKVLIPEQRQRIIRLEAEVARCHRREKFYNVALAFLMVICGICLVNCMGS
nr:hypothetical protein CFP56_56690 [Quercus suber]